MKFRDSFHPYALLTILFWSLAYVLTRLALRYFSAFSLGFLRYFTASCALCVILSAAKIKAPEKTDGKWFLAAGFFGFFLYMIAFNQGCETVTAATGSVVIATVPAITALLARVIYREKLSVFQWTATGIELSGVIILTRMNHTLSVNRGLFWMFLAAAALSVYNLLQRKLTRTYSGLQASAYSIFTGTVLLALFLPDAVREAWSAPPIQWLLIAVLGIFSSAVAYATWAQAFKKAERTSLVSNYMFLTPLLTALLGLVLAGERPDRATMTGGAVILAGVLIFNFGGRICGIGNSPHGRGGGRGNCGEGSAAESCAPTP